MSVDSKAEANSLLKFGIGVAKGEHGWSSSTQRKYRLILVANLIQRLFDSGFSWQARILRYWLHRCMKGEFDKDPQSCRPERPDLSPGERREAS